jgi:dihydrofolate reductase
MRYPGDDMRGRHSVEVEMRRIIVLNSVTVDGVMQGPGRPDEDTRGGFDRGGWAVAGSDDVMVAAMGEHLTRSGGLLLGRRSYEDILGYWNAAGGPFKDPLNDASKYVASHRSEPLAWPNSTLLTGDVPRAVADLKKDPGDDLHIMGSGVLIRSLLPHGLIDGFMLMIHPVVLGSGRTLFTDGDPRLELHLVKSESTTTGVVIATYETAKD